VLSNGPTVREHLREQGYFAARVGKIYHLGIPGQVGTPGPDDPESWTTTFNPKGAEFDTDGEEGWPDRKDGQGFRYVMGKSNGIEQHDYQAADEAIRILREKKDQPFFLALGFIRPHVPEIAPKTFFEQYPLDVVKLPVVPENDRDDIPPLAFTNAKQIDRGMTVQQCKESLRAYNACTSFMDAQVGRVIEELDKLGLAEKTVVTFIGDHGYALGQHHSWQKMMLFEPVARVPMMIVAPGVKPAVTRSIIESIDLYPTIAELCELKTAERMDGKSQAPVLRDPTASVKQAAYTQVRRGANGQGYSVRTDRYRYTEWRSKGGTAAELYDEQADPEEFTNLANDPKHADTVKETKKLLSAMFPAS
jgi:uncharacterized sulfatase